MEYRNNPETWMCRLNRGGGRGIVSRVAAALDFGLVDRGPGGVSKRIFGDVTGVEIVVCDG